MRRFLFRLCRELGEWNVDQVMQAMPARLLNEWRAFDRLDPMGYERADLANAITAATIANVNRGKNRPPYKAADFMPKFGERAKPKQMSDQEIEMRFRAFAAAHNAFLESKGGR